MNFFQTKNIKAGFIIETIETQLGHSLIDTDQCHLIQSSHPREDRLRNRILYSLSDQLYLALHIDRPAGLETHVASRELYEFS